LALIAESLGLGSPLGALGVFKGYLVGSIHPVVDD